MMDQAISIHLQTSISTDWRFDFSGWLEEHGKSEHTISAYLQDIGQFAIWFAGVNRQPLAPDLVTGVDLRAYREYSIGVERPPPPGTGAVHHWRNSASGHSMRVI